MTDSTPRQETPVTSATLINLSGFSISREIMNNNRSQSSTCPPPPPPVPSSSSSDDFPPAALSLPMLAPRSIKHRRRAEPEDSQTLMSFVSHMSLNDVAATFSSGRTCYAPTQRNPFLPRAATSSAPELEEEPPMEKSVSQLAAMAMEVSDDSAQWSLTTPESVKTTITTPRGLRNITTPLAFRATSQKRKTPLVQSTPVDGNPPLMMPSLTVAHVPGASSSTSSTCCTGGRSNKKAKNYKSLLNNAPMLPASPDLEDRDLAAPRWHPPCFSPPVGGVTLVNPNYRVPVSTPVLSPPPQRRVLPVAAAAAGLPSLDEAERSAPKWLRMKKRTSLLYALRMAATES